MLKQSTNLLGRILHLKLLGINQTMEISTQRGFI